jgi:hypothetical protein
MTEDRALAPSDFFDLAGQNPWWDDPNAIPAAGEPRADLYWRVRNTLEADLLVIPGPPVTGTTATLRQLVRALAVGADHNHGRVASLFADEDRPDAYRPEQLCYVDCSDPVAHLDDSFVETVRRAYHRMSAQTGTLSYYLLFDGIHHLGGWREQLRAERDILSAEFPENWTLVATVPVAELAHDLDHEALDIDRPHLPQKYRDALVRYHPELRGALQPPSAEDDPIERVRETFHAAAAGDASPEELAGAFEAVDAAISEHVGDHLSEDTDQYLVDGGFGPALENESPTHTNIASHVTQALEQTLYRDVPRMAEYEESIPRIDRPEELHALVALLSRREFTETTYKNLGEFLSCDTRTIRQKYVPLLERLHLGERATRYDLQRDRTLRFYPRGPGYATAFEGRGVTSANRTDRLRVALADHLRRLLASLDGTGGLQYWRDDGHVLDYVLELEGGPVPFVSAFADVGDTPAFDAFADAVETPHLEVVLAGSDAEVAAEPVGERVRVTIPYPAMLAVC